MATLLSWLAAAIAIFGLQAFLQRRVFAGFKLLEIRPFGYTEKDADELLSRLGKSRRMQYAWFQGLDFALILAATQTMLAMQHLGSHGVNDAPLRFAPILPRAYAATDVAEDVALLVLTAAYPRGIGLSRIASRLTSIKFALLGVSFTASLLVAVWGTVARTETG
jgi:hypothetical protein